MLPSQRGGGGELSRSPRPPEPLGRGGGGGSGSSGYLGPALHRCPGPGGRSVGLSQVTWGRGFAAWEPGKVVERERARQREALWGLWRGPHDPGGLGASRCGEGRGSHTWGPRGSTVGPSGNRGGRQDLLRERRASEVKGRACSTARGTQ